MKNRSNRRSLYAPTFGVMLTLAICCLGVYIIGRNYKVSYDTFWHIKAGEQLVKKGMPIKVFGSWLIGDKEWMAHEWLFDWLIYHVSCMGLQWVKAVAQLFYILVVCICCKQSGVLSSKEQNPPLYWLLVLIPGFFMYTSVVAARPQDASALLLAVFCVILQNAVEKQQYKQLYILPVLAVVWSNIHGGTAMLSYIMVAIVFLCAVAGFFIEDIGLIVFERPEKKLIVHMGTVLMLTVGANMINPYGYRMLIYPYENMMDDIMISHITEWASPDAKQLWVLLCGFLPVLLGMVALIHVNRRLPAYRIALFFMFFILYLRSTRFISYLVVVQTCMVTSCAFDVQRRSRDDKKCLSGGKSDRIWKKIMDVVLRLVPVAEIIAILLLLADSVFTAPELNTCISDKMLQVVKEDNPVRLMNHYNVGGYLLYQGIDVFVDGRYEPYQANGIIEDYFTITAPENIEEYEEIGELIQKYDFDAFLIYTKNVSLIAYLNTYAPQYHLLYADDEWVYYSIH